MTNSSAKKNEGWNGENFLKEAKILKNLYHPNVVNFKIVFYQSLAIMFENVSFEQFFPRLK